MVALAAVFQPIHALLEQPITNLYSILAILLFFGLLFGYLAKLIHLPTITGNILAGLLIGPVFGVVDTVSPTTSAQLDPITSLALSLIAITIGSHLKFGLIHNALKRILIIVMVEIVVLPLFVFVAIYGAMSIGKYSAESIFQIALFMGILSIATAPATIVHLVKELQAKGVLVKTLIGVVVFNNVANIVLFEVARHLFFDRMPAQTVWVIAGEVFGAILLGVFIAMLLLFVWRKVYNRRQIATLSFSALIIAYGLAILLGVSPVLTNLALGVTITNLSMRNQLLQIFEDFDEVLYALFFTLTGTHASFAHLGAVGGLAAIYLFCRVGGNLATVYLSRFLTALPKRVNKYLALALSPQAGITVGLIVTLEADDVSGVLASWVTPVVLLAVTFSEILGPPILRFCLRRSGEAGQALPRLIDFIEEEYITVDITSRTRRGIIRELVDFLFKTHPLKELDKESFFQAVLKREKEQSTAVGRGVAIPHGYIPGGPNIVGVMGILRKGIRWGAPDGKPVHMVILIGTPPEREEQHLGVLAAIGRIFHDKTVTDRGLHLAETAADVYEALVDEEFVRFNRVLLETSRD